MIFVLLTLTVVVNGQRFSLDGDWSFAPLAADGAPSAAAQTVTLPHNATPLSFRNWQPSSWEQRFRYNKTFDRPADTSAPGTRFVLEFEGAMTAAEVTFNGFAFPAHVGGYLPFSFELPADRVRATNNALEVIVDGRYLNVPPNMAGDGKNASATDFYQPAGLYRSVWLHALPPLFVADSLFAKPVSVLSASERAVVVEYTLDSALPSGEYDVDVTFAIRDVSGALVTSLSERLRVQSPSRRVFSSRITSGLSNIALWSLERPQLYELSVVAVVAAAQVKHAGAVRFGFRSAVFTKEGFFLNGERLQIVGLNRHHLFPFMGAAVTRRHQRRDVDILKQTVNFVRQSHYPQVCVIRALLVLQTELRTQDTSFLDACDEQGLLVWAEPPGLCLHLSRVLVFACSLRSTRFPCSKAGVILATRRGRASCYAMCAS